MTSVLWWMLQNAIVVALLVLLVLPMCRLLRSRPALQHALWLVVLVKFVTPPLVSWPWSAGDISDRLALSVTPVEEEFASVPASVPVDMSPDGKQPEFEEPHPAVDPGVPAPAVPGSIADMVETDTTVEPIVAPPAPAHPAATELAPSLLIGLWIAGCMIALAVQTRRIARHVAVVRQGTPAPPALVNEIAAVAGKLRLRPVPALVVRQIASPFLWCLGRLRLIWPQALSGDHDVRRCRGIIAHELAHVRRRDHWVAWLELAAGILWWWNPLFWYVRRQLRQTADLACDAQALNLASGADRRAYAEMLLELSRLVSERQTPAPALGVSTAARRSIERRLSMILNEHVKGKTSPVALAAVILFAGFVLPGFSLGQTDVEPSNAAATQPAESSSKTTNATQEKLQWGEPVNGLRAAIAIRPASGEAKADEMPDIYLAVQNVSDAPIRLTDTKLAPKLRYLKIKLDGKTQAGLVSKDPTGTDVTLQPREAAYLLMFGSDWRDEDGRTSGSILAEDALKETHRTMVAEMQIENAPAGAWTGKLVTGETSGAVAAGQPPSSVNGMARRGGRFTTGLTGNGAKIAYSADGKLIAVANGNPTRIMQSRGTSRVKDDWKPLVQFLDAQTGRIVVALKLSTDEEDAALAATERVSHFEVTAIAFSPDGNVLAVGTSIGQVKLYEARTGQPVRSLDDEAGKRADDETPENWKSLSRAMGSVLSLAFSPDSRLLATSGESFADFSDIFDGVSRLGERGTGPGRLKVWDVETGALKHDLVGHNDHAYAVAFSPDGRTLASAGRWSKKGDTFGNGVLLWNPHTGTQIHSLIRTTANAGARAIAFSPDSKHLAIGTQRFGEGASTGGVSLVSVSEGIVSWLQTVPGWAKPLGFSPDGKIVAVLCGGHSIRFLESENGRMVDEIRADSQGGRWHDFALAPPGDKLAIGAVDGERRGSVEVWNVGGLLAAFHSAPAASIPTPRSPDGAAANLGTLTGRFVVDGEPPTPQKLAIPTERRTLDNRSFPDPELARYNRLGLIDRSLVVGDNRGIKNVLIWIVSKDVLVSPQFNTGEKPVLRVTSGQFKPRVLAFQAPGTLLVKNEEQNAHNVTWRPIRNKAFNRLVPSQGSFEVAIERPDGLPTTVTSSLFPWMKAWLFPCEHSYFACSAEDGTFRIENIPPGEWEFRVWHERTGYVQTADWPKGRFTRTTKTGENSLGTIELAAGLFADKPTAEIKVPGSDGSAALADERAKWTVLINANEDHATIQATGDANSKLIQATIAALQQSGVQKFVLESRPAEKQSHVDSKTWLSIDVDNDSAEITSAKSLPYKYVESVIQHLSKSGINKIKFAPPTPNTGRVENPGTLDEAADLEKETPEMVVRALQGDWIVVGIEGGGEKATPEESRGMRWSIGGDVITATDPDGSSVKMRYTVNPSESPKHFDITSLEGEQKGQTDPGIYELKDGLLGICYRDPDNKNGQRPKSFMDAAPKGSGYGIIILKKKSEIKFPEKKVPGTDGSATPNAGRVEKPGAADAAAGQDKTAALRELQFRRTAASLVRLLSLNNDKTSHLEKLGHPTNSAGIKDVAAIHSAGVSYIAVVARRYPPELKQPFGENGIGVCFLFDGDGNLKARFGGEVGPDGVNGDEVQLTTLGTSDRWFIRVRRFQKNDRYPLGKRSDVFLVEPKFPLAFRVWHHGSMAWSEEPYSSRDDFEFSHFFNPGGLDLGVQGQGADGEPYHLIIGWDADNKVFRGPSRITRNDSAVFVVDLDSSKRFTPVDRRDTK